MLNIMVRLHCEVMVIRFPNLGMFSNAAVTYFNGEIPILEHVKTHIPLKCL